MSESRKPHADLTPRAKSQGDPPAKSRAKSHAKPLAKPPPRSPAELRSEPKAFRNFSLMYIILALSGILLFINENLFLIGAFFLFGYLMLREGITPRELIPCGLFLAAVVVITAVQTLQFGRFVPESFLSVIILLTVGFLAAHVMEDRFVNIFVRLMYVMSVISLVFYTLTLVFPPLLTAAGNLVDVTGIDPHWTKNMFFYNFIDAEAMLTEGGILRNAGFVYEPGMFACLLIPALAFNTIFEDSLLNRRNKVFLITLVTTFSTAAYLSLAVFLVLYFTVSRGFSLMRSLMVLGGAAVVMLLFWQLEFIGGKIQEQRDRALHGAYSTRYMGRIGSALVDMQSIAAYPWAGRGRHVETRFDAVQVFYNPGFTHRVNGITHLMASMGVPFFLFYVYRMSVTAKRLSRKVNANPHLWVILVIPLLVMALSQLILLRPFFIALLFLREDQIWPGDPPSHSADDAPDDSPDD